MAGPESLDADLELAHSFLDDVFPDAVLIAPAVLAPAEERRIRAAGFGMVEVVLEGGEVQFATYVAAETPYVRAVEAIWLAEQDGELPSGSHSDAMDSLVNGEFDNQWGAYVPRQTD